jgi:hypothetical protein
MHTYHCKNTSNPMLRPPKSLAAMRLWRQIPSSQMRLPIIMVLLDMVDPRSSNYTVRFKPNHCFFSCAMSPKCLAHYLTSSESSVNPITSLVIMLKFKLVKLSKPYFSCTVLKTCKVNLSSTSESCIKVIKKVSNHIMDRANTPSKFWLTAYLMKYLPG